MTYYGADGRPIISDPHGSFTFDCNDDGRDVVRFEWVNDLTPSGWVQRRGRTMEHVRR